MLLWLLLLSTAMAALWFSNHRLKRRIEELAAQLGALRHQADAPPAATPEPQPAEPRPSVAQPPRARGSAAWDGTPEAPPEVAGPREPSAPVRETLAGLFETLVGGRLLIWIGGIALAIAGIFLIRYSIDLVTPELRMAAAALFGLALLGAGEAARSGRLLKGDPRVAQALVGAGLAVLYAATYASHVLYGLIGLPLASGLMLAVTAAALVLSLRHGAPTALMGLAGGFLSPALVGDPDAGAVPLLAYLAVLNVAIFALAARRGWTWLAAGAVVLTFLWTGSLIVGPAPDAFAAGLLIVALALAASLVRPGEGRQLRLLHPAVIGAVQVAVLVARTDLGLAAWALFGTLGAGALALAVVRPAFRAAAPVALGLAVLLLLVEAMVGTEADLPAAAAGITLLFGGFGLAAALRRPTVYWTALASTGLAAPVLALRLAAPGLLQLPSWGALEAVLAAAPAMLAWKCRGAARAEPPASLSLMLPAAAAAMLLGAALHDLLPPRTIAAAWLALAVGAAAAGRRLRDVGIATVAVGVAAIAVARCLWMVPELSTAFVTALIGEPVLASDLPGVADAAWALLLPSALLLGLWRALGESRIGGRRAVPAVAGLFAVAAAYLFFKHAFGLSDRADFVARGLAERTLVTQGLFLLGFLFGTGLAPKTWLGPEQRRLAATVLTGLAAARFLWFDLFAHNPAWAVQWVGTVPVLNLLLPAYLLSAAWLFAARRREPQPAAASLWLGLFLAALIVGGMLMVRQAFQGPILTGAEMPLAEFYGYSLAGLVLSIGLLVAGIRLGDKALRLSGLLLLTATILKVFLIDASALEGLLRILSFLGLGVALIGIGRLYAGVLRSERAPPATAGA